MGVTCLSLKLRIHNFKSFDNLSVELGDLTLLVGQAASGKSNLLEALETLGYTLKVLVEASLGEYPINYPPAPFNYYVRSVRCLDLINRHKRIQESSSIVHLEDLEKRISFKVNIGCLQDPSTVHINLGIGDINGKLAAQLVEKILDTSSYGSSDISVILQFLGSVISSMQISSHIKEKEDLKTLPRHVIAPRLYGFDRMNVVTNIMYRNTRRRYPYSYLEERATNLGWILYNNDDVLDEINHVLEELGFSIQIEPLSDGQLAFRDGGKDIGPVSISDTVLRLLYMLTIFLTSKKTTYKAQGVTLYPLVMLEEPEAHVYPFAFSDLIQTLYETLMNDSSLIITTHSGNLAQRLWEKYSGKKDVKIYYVIRNKSRSTILYEVDMVELLNEGLDLDMLVSQPMEKIEELINHNVLFLQSSNGDP